jgi:signal transduction histidine kinase
VQEALTNTVRHADASNVRVSVAEVGSDLVVDVTDDGTAPGADATDVDGHGIRGMRERVAALGGTLEAGANETGGFSVRGTIPLPGRAS